MKRFARLARLNQRTPTALLRIVLALLTVAALLGLAGCRKIPGFFDNRGTPPAPPPKTATPPPTPPADARKEVIAVVTDYVNAMGRHDYAAAYAMLSQESQSLHTQAAFEEQGKQGMPSYDLTSAQVLSLTGADALVEVKSPPDEDPNAYGFALVRENAQWKIVYRGGTPGSPSSKPRTTSFQGD